MTKADLFVSVDEQALEVVAGGLLDLANGSVNGNAIKLLSDINVGVQVGNVASYLLNALNEVSCAVGSCGHEAC